MAFTVGQLQALEAAFASGELMVRYDGKQIQYRSLDELDRAIARVRNELIAAGQLAPPADGGRGGSTRATFESE